MTARGGFTLVELAVAMVLALAVGGLIQRHLVLGQRLARAQTERMALQDNVRVAATVLAGELGQGDLLSIAPGAVTYLAQRGAGQICGVAAGSPAELVVEAASWTSSRAPRATDSLLVFAEGDPLTGGDDAWLHLGIVSSAAASCPAGLAGIALRVAAPAPLDPAAVARVTPGAPARLAEVMELRYYRSGGQAWLGMRSISTGEVIQPVAGPLADSTASTRGLTLRYLDAAGHAAATPGSVRAVDIALLGITDQPVHGRVVGRATVDSFALGSRVTLRNAPWP